MAEWEEKISEFNGVLCDDSFSFEEKRDKIVYIVRTHPAFSTYNGPTGEEAEDEDEFDESLAQIYDFADEHRIWLGLGLHYTN